MLKGHCLCGTVTWKADAEPTPLSHCHCGMCRKAHGAPFVTFTSCPKAALTWTSGEEAIREYTSSPGLLRRFCGLCGSALPGEIDSLDEASIPVGGMNPEPDLTGGPHIFTGSKLPWMAVPEDAEDHDTYPEDEPLPVIDRAPMQMAEGDAPLAGSCLCGDVAFEIDAPFTAIFNCHCSRCRMARAAAHATNGFVPGKALRFSRGEDTIVDFKLPEAAAFGQAFCKTCGSGVPRYNALREMYNVPLGVLDVLSATGPSAHIFVASKATWHEIADDIPQFEGSVT